MKKKCERCGEQMFYIRKNKRYCGIESKKGDCAYVMAHERLKKYYAQNKNGYADKQNKAMNQWHKQNREKHNGYLKKYYQTFIKI